MAAPAARHLERAVSPIDVILWVAVVILALAAGWLSLPRPPALDWERLFKLSMVTLLRGPIEGAGGSAEAWLAAGRALVYYNPAARDAVAKLTDPGACEVAVPALPGERALLEALRAAQTPAERVALAFGKEADAALYDDPAELGAGWDLAALLGQGATWDALAGMTAPLREALRRRNDRRRWVIVADPTREEPLDALRDALAEVLGPDRVVVLRESQTEALARALDAQVPELADRLVIVAVGEGAMLALRDLRQEAGQRDRVLAVVTLSAALGDAAWLAEQFTHVGMDTELNRRTPYFYLSFIEPGCEVLGEPGRPAAHSRVPSPPVPETGRASILAIDLGVLPGSVAATRQDILGRALLVVVSVYLALAG